MYRYSNGQISLSDFKQPVGMNLREINRWVKKLRQFPGWRLSTAMVCICIMFIYFWLPHCVPTTYCSWVQSNISAEFLSCNTTAMLFLLEIIFASFSEYVFGVGL